MPPKKSAVIIALIVAISFTIITDIGFAVKKTPDVQAYEELVLAPATEHPTPEGLDWKSIAIGYVFRWQEFQEKFPDSHLIPQSNLRIAKWYLTIHKNDETSTEGFNDENSGKYKPENLNQAYREIARKYLNEAIRLFADTPHYSYLGDGDFGFNGDTVDSIALYLRAIFFPETRQKDVCLLKERLKNTPSAQEAFRDFPKILSKCK